MAKPVPTMPNEIWDHILSFSSSRELWRARQVSREFFAISIAHSFRYVPLDASSEKLKGIYHILATKHWANSVRKLIVIGPQPDTDMSKDEFGMSKILRDLLRDLPKFENLSSLCISNRSSTRTPTSHGRERIVAFRKDFLASVLTPLINSPFTKTRIEHLHISPLQSRDDPDLTRSLAFVNFLSNIRFLKLATQSERTLGSPKHHVVLPEPSVNFYRMLPDTWLLPACQTLNVLYLTADFNWGWYPKVDFRHIHFPNLQSLALRAFSFSNNWQLEWLLSHAGSLRRLRLTECSILAFANASLLRFLDSDGYIVHTDDDTKAGVRRYHRFEARWCDHFKAFASALPLLQFFSLQDTKSFYLELEVGFEPAVREEELACIRCKSRYMASTPDGYVPFFNPEMDNHDELQSSKHWQEQEQSQRTKDEKALLELFDAIERRVTSKT